MAIVLNGTTGIQNVLGSASAPAESNTTSSNTGLYFPSSTTLGLSINGTNAVYVDASQNVGIGTTSPGYKLDVQGSSSGAFSVNFQNTNSGSSAQARATFTSTSNTLIVGSTNDTTLGGGGFFYNGSAVPITFFTSATERMRIDSSGQLILKRTAAVNAATIVCSTGQNSRQVSFVNNNNNNEVGYIFCNNDGTTTQYATTSDYRLKENVQPITTGLAIISSLKPVTYDWIDNNSKGEGFIAHELQEHIPLAVNGTKDEVNEEGKPVYQGVDYSKIVVHLVAAVQELSAKVDAQAAEIAALKAKVPV